MSFGGAMKKVSIVLAAVMVTLLMACGSSEQGQAKADGNDNMSSAQASSANIAWARFDDALTAAAAEDKHVIAYFWRDGCPWCTKMENGTFSDANVIDYVNANFAPAKVKTSSNDVYKTPFGDMNVMQLARSLQIRGVPAVYFFDSEAKPVFNIPGYVPADMYQVILKYVAEKHYMNKSFEEFKEIHENGS